MILNAICVINFEYWSWVFKIFRRFISFFFVSIIQLIIARSSRSTSWWRRYSEIWKKLWAYILVNLSLLTRFESFCNKYTIDKRVSKERRSRHVNNARNYFNSNYLCRIYFDIVHEIYYVDALREVCNLFSLWRWYQISWFDDWQVDRHKQVFLIWWIKSYLKKVFECSQTSRTSLTQNANVLHESCYRIERFWFEKLTIHIKDAIDECLRIFSTHDDSMFDSFIKRSLIINCTLSFNDNRHRLEALIDIDAIDYAFIDREIAQLVCNMLNMKSVSLLKSKSLIEFDDRHVSSIIYVIYFKLTIELHFELIVLLLIIDFDNHSIILKKSWINKHEIILNMIYDKLIFKSFKCNHHDNIFNQTMQIRRLKTLKSNRR